MPEDTKIYVGNLAWKCLEEDLRKYFEPCGPILKATICADRETNRSRGFGFVEFASRDAVGKAIAELGNKEFMDRVIVVREALPRKPRDSRTQSERPTYGSPRKPYQNQRSNSGDRNGIENDEYRGYR